MVELALHISGMKDISFLEKIEDIFSGIPEQEEDITASDPLSDEFLPALPALKLFNIVLKPILGGSSGFERVYFGNEFCQHLIPAIEHIDKVKKIAKEKHLKFTLVTPYVTDSGMKNLLPLFSYLDECDENIEVVVNDYGVLYALSSRYRRLVPVLGRLMNKMERDPRFAMELPSGMTPGQLSVWQQTCLSQPHYKRILAEMGIKRFEFDIVPQGMKVDLSDGRFPASLYYPWTYTTTGRICETGSINLDNIEKFRLDIPCQKECQKYFACWVPVSESKNEYDARSARSCYIFKIGNAIFMLCEAPGEIIRNLFSQGFDRIVYGPGLPL